MKAKKVLVSMLSAAMILGTMAVPALADGETAVAKIGNTEYATLAAAFAAAQDGETITVVADSAGNGIKVSQGKYTTGLTVDFGDHKYTVDGTTVGSAGTETNGFQLLKGNNITFQNGTIESAKAKILVQNYSNLKLEGMTLTMDNKEYDGAYTLSNNNGNIVIQNTTINANTGGGYAFDVCRYASYPSVSVTVSGNSVINGDVEVSASKGDAKDGFSLNFESGTMNGNIVMDPSAVTAMENAPGKASVPAAITGKTVYGTLEAAVSAAANGATITLVSDATLSDTIVIEKDLTIDLNGNSIYATDARALWVKSGNVMITGSAGVVSSETSSENSTFDDTSSVIRVGDSKANAKAAKLTIDSSVTVSSAHCYGVTVFGKNDTDNNLNTSDIEFVLNYGGSVSVSGSQAAISGNGTKTNSATKMTINGSVYTMNNEEYAIYHPGKGTLTINNDAVVNGYGGIEAKAGKVIVNGGEIIADADSTSHTTNNNGPSTSGYAIAAVNNKSYAGEPTITVKGGEITGKVAIEDDTNATEKNASIAITGGTFSKDPQTYVAQGYASVPSDDEYNVKPVAQLDQSEMISALASATAEAPVTIKSAVKNETYDQVTGTTVSLDEDKTFSINSSEDGFPKQTVTLTNITGGTTITGEGDILCGLIITGIPQNVTVTVTPVE